MNGWYEEDCDAEIRHGDSEAVTRGNAKPQSLSGRAFQNWAYFE
jgi:hypothetical protein